MTRTPVFHPAKRAFKKTDTRAAAPDHKGHVTVMEPHAQLFIRHCLDGLNVVLPFLSFKIYLLCMLRGPLPQTVSYSMILGFDTFRAQTAIAARAGKWRINLLKPQNKATHILFFL